MWLCEYMWRSCMCVGVCLFVSLSFFFVLFDCITYRPMLVWVKKWKQVIALMDFYIHIQISRNLNKHTHTQWQLGIWKFYDKWLADSLVMCMDGRTDDTSTGQQTNTLTDFTYCKRTDKCIWDMVFVFFGAVILVDGHLLLR